MGKMHNPERRDKRGPESAGSTPAYPAINPFVDPVHGKRGRPPRDYLKLQDDERVNQRYKAFGLVLSLEEVCRAVADAAAHGWQWEMTPLPDGRVLVTFKKLKGPLPTQKRA